MVVNVLCKMEDMQNPLPVHDQYQGIYLLMVHPNEKVCPVFNIVVLIWLIISGNNSLLISSNVFYIEACCSVYSHILIGKNKALLFESISWEVVQRFLTL